MSTIHMTPEQALAAHAILGTCVSIATHYGTFLLADDGEAEPLGRLHAALEASGSTQYFWVLDEGEGRDIPTLESFGSNAKHGDNTRQSVPLLSSN